MPDHRVDECPFPGDVLSFGHEKAAQAAGPDSATKTERQLVKNITDPRYTDTCERIESLPDLGMIDL